MGWLFQSLPKAFWASAEEIVSIQFPGIAGKIKWPDDQIHVSIYGKLKYLYRKFEMKTLIKELFSHYSAISSHRNSLFHGVLDKRLPVECVTQAIESFDWIDNNMLLKDSC
jgi:hypothetical protein